VLSHDNPPTWVCRQIAGNRGLDVNRLHSKKLYLIRTPRKAPIWQPGTGYYRGRVGRTRSPPQTKKTRAAPFESCFPAPTASGSGVSAPSYRRNHGPSATSFKHPIRNHQQVGKAATVAGDVGPGFHTWPTGHIPQATDPNALIRNPAPSFTGCGARANHSQTD
jgi:hypothetical protein